ncbi:DUF305 domain-containing protein [Nocardia thailandica]|uniref:DUF305 domain-containing protein n=1 Tax=Nocardia thailandica TaxID=257275 RepID=UPI0002E5D54D|nr:DUF305 domain-containing protein [Nocardia thailandica]
MSVFRVTAVAVATAATLFAAGCGDDSAPAPAATSNTTTPAPTGTQAAAYTEADVTFLQMMYPHHAQAVEMARLVPSRSQNPELIALAANVEKAQAPEMEQITTLLTGWGKPAPTADMGHGGHGGHTMSGMMTADQMTALAAASGPAFDRMWLEMMIDHHLGAVEMAKTELAAGVNTEARALATAIVADQEKEIAQMRAMLAQR